MGLPDPLRPVHESADPLAGILRGKNVGTPNSRVPFLFPWLLKVLYRPVEFLLLLQKVPCLMSSNCLILPPSNDLIYSKGSEIVIYLKGND